MAGVSSSNGISSTLGSYSGITAKDIDKLIEAESLPLVKLNHRKTQLSEQQNAWKDVKLRLNTLLGKIDNLQKNATFNTKKITSSQPEKVTMSATDSAETGSYQIVVEQLATATKVASGEILALKDQTIYDSLNLKGSLELTNDAGQVSTLEISEGDSAKEIITKINANSKETGIKGSLIDNRIVISNVATGAKTLNVGGSLAKELGLSPESRTVTEGDNAKFKIDGMSVVRSSNTITDVIENVTINLHGETKEAATISLATDDEKAVAAAKDLVEQYNAVMDFINEKLNTGDPSKKDNKPGSLSGDSSLIRLQSSLRLLMTSSPGENQTTGHLKPAEIGIDSKDRTSLVVFDEAKFREALGNDPQAVQNFFFNKIPQEVEITDQAGVTTTVKDKKEVGYTVKLKELMNTYLSDANGARSVYTSKTETLSQNLKELDSRIERFTAQIDKKRDYYVKTFTRLDQVMMQAESQMAYLQSQMDSFTAR